MIKYQAMGERLRSIPPNIRGGVTVRIGGGGIGSSRRAARETWRDGEEDWGKVVDEQAFRKPVRGKPTTQARLSGIEEKIGWEAEVMGNYNAQGDLGIFLQFNGINLTRASFMRGRRYYGPDTTLFYSPIIYDKREVLLLLSTCGDIFETQVVPEKKDVNPFFQEEIYFPSLAKTHDPRSMTVNQKNNLVIVGYKLR